MKFSLSAIFSKIRHELWWPIVLTFFCVNIVVRHSGGVNAFSRYAMTLGMITEGTFTIDPYVNLTPDWSQTPDGRYFSNKPPGPSIIGYPIAFVLDSAFIDDAQDKNLLHDDRVKFASISNGVQAIFLQIFPFIFFVILLDRMLANANVSLQARTLTLFCALFGSTPSLLMNTQFGHGMAAAFSLGAYIFALKCRVRWSAFCFGVSLLADYGAAFVLPGLIWFWLRRPGGTWRKSAQDVVVGATIPAIIWIWYHKTCFYSPFATSHKYLAPEWVSVPSEQNALWGIFSKSPDFGVLIKLLIGYERGILFFSPWVILVVLYSLYLLFINRTKHKSAKSFGFSFFEIASCLILSLVGLLLANSSFNGWHGGATMGPRYLSTGLMLFPILIGLTYDSMNKNLQKLCVFCVGVSVVFFCLSFPQDILTAMNPWKELVEHWWSRTPGMMIKVSLPAIAIILVARNYYVKYFFANKSN
jgi:hypothetical protein